MMNEGFATRQNFKEKKWCAYQLGYRYTLFRVPRKNQKPEKKIDDCRSRDGVRGGRGYLSAVLYYLLTVLHGR